MLQHSDFRRLWGSSWVRRRMQGSQVVGAASAAKAESADFRRLWGSSWVRRRLQGSQVVGAASAANAEKRVSATSVVAAISEGYGEARECGVDCKADSPWAQRRLPRRKTRERDKRFQGQFQIKADRVDDLDAGYACGNVTSLRFPKTMGKLVGAASTARRSGCGRSDGCQGGKRGKFQIKADRVDDLDSGYACGNVTSLRFPNAMVKLVGAASTARQSGCGRSVGCQGGKRKLFQGKLKIKADRVDELDAGYACSNVTALRFLKAMGKLVAAASTARQSGCGRRVGCQGGKRKRFQGKLQIKADRVEVLDSGYACSNVTALRFPKARGKLELFQKKFQIKGDRVEDLDAGYACRNVTTLQFPKAMGKLKVFQGKLQIKADRGDDLDSGYACSNVTALRFPTAMEKLVSAASTARQSGCERSVGCQGGKRVSATLSLVVKADRVDELDAGYACSDVTALRFPKAMGKLVGAASTARLSGCGRSGGCQGGKRVSATDFLRLWGSSWLRRRLQGSQVVGAASAAKAEKRKLFQGKLQIKADRVDELDAGYACSNVTALRFPKAMGKLVGAASTARRTARGRSVGCQGGKRKRFQGKFQIKADRVDELDAGSISEGYGEARGCGVDCKADSSWPQRRLPRRKARERDKRCQGKFQIKADRVEDLDSGYACRNVTALRFPTAMKKLVSAASTARQSGCGRSVGCQGGKRVSATSVVAGNIRFTTIDSDFRRLGGSSWLRRRLQGSQVVGAASAAKAENADFRRLWGSSWLRRRLQGGQLVGAASAAKAESANYSKRKFQIKADRVEDLDSGYARSDVTALRFPKAMGKL
ncbi:hypothetical protein GN958_ATG17826, partial [Phytophthora infestans]